MNYENWDELRKGRNSYQLVNEIMKGIRKTDILPLSRKTVGFLCSYNSIRELADTIAHEASQTEIQNAVAKKRGSKHGLQLEELYNFVYNT